MRILSAVKNVLVPHGARPRRIPLGLLRGVQLHVDLSSALQVYLGLSERELAPWFARLSRGIRSALDVGTSDGIYALFLLQKTPAERVWAFEPDPAARQRFEENLRLNRLLGSSRLELVSRYVGARDDDTQCTLDGVASDVPGPVLVKLDIEGHELDALRGASKLLARRDVRWIVEVHSRELDDACSAMFRERGYRVQHVPRAAYRLILPELRPGEHNAWFVATRPEERF